MKKITLLLILLTVSFGFAQTLPVDFELAEDEFGDFGSTFNIVDGTTNAPPTNSAMIGEIIGGAGSFDNIQLTMATYIDVTNVANNTITFDFYSPDTDVMTGLLQLTDRLNLQDGQNVPVEIQFTTSGVVGWETFTLDFDTAGNGYPFCSGCPDSKPVVLDQFAKIVFFTDFNANTSDTYYLDNIAGAQNGGPTVSDPIPSGPAPNPIAPDAEVFNIYSDTGGYTNNMAYDYCFGTLDGEPNLDDMGGINNAHKYNFGIAGFGCGQNGPTDVSSAMYVNFDYWASTSTTTFRAYLISGVPPGATTESFYEIGVDNTIVQEAWTRVSIPISHFTGQGFDVNNYLQYKFDVLAIEAGSIVYMDNYFLSDNESLSVDDFNTTEFSVYPNPTENVWNINTNNQNINSIHVYDVLGKRVLTLEPNTQEIAIDATTLKSGLYFAKINSINGTQTLKLVRK